MPALGRTPISLLFLGSLRGTAAVFLSIPLSALAAIIALYFGGSTINSMVLAGLAIVFSRLIDNSVIVLENIFRHMELGERPEVAAEKGGQEVNMAVLAATIASAVVFFPVTFLYGVSKFLFSALALAVVLALFASYFVAMTVVPLFCATLIKDVRQRAIPEAGSKGTSVPEGEGRPSWGTRFSTAFNHKFRQGLNWYEGRVDHSLRRPWLVVTVEHERRSADEREHLAHVRFHHHPVEGDGGTRAQAAAQVGHPPAAEAFVAGNGRHLLA